GYVMSGAAVARLLGEKGVWYSITLLASSLMLTVIAQLLMAYFITYDVRYILQWWYDISGFMVNRNAFALMAMLLLCFLLAWHKKMNHRQAKYWFDRHNLLLAGLIVACMLTQSRVVLILLPLLLIWYYVMGYINIGKLLSSVMVTGAVMILWGLLVPALMKIITGVQAFPIIAYRFGAYAPDRGSYASEIIGDNESDVLRGENWTQAWELFISSPIFGSGLGGFLHHYQEKVIHNVPLWIAAEMGIIGLLLVAPLPMILLYYIFKQGIRLSEQKFILLNCLLVWGAFSMVQDMSFQRIIWYILGLMLAVRITSHSQNITKDKENDA
nr:O-antigen ligase family protein [Alphaproteobacteria bacterium]